MARSALSVRKALPALIALTFLLVIWEGLVRTFPQEVPIIPAPSQVVGRLIRDQEVLITRHIPTTMLETLIGLAIALILGIVIAVGLDALPVIRRAIYPLLVISQTIPIIAIAPLLLLILDFGIGPKVVVVVIFCFFPIATAMLDGLAVIEPRLITATRAFGGGTFATYRYVRLPASLPSLFTGFRIAAAYSVTGAITGEYITSQYGLGQYLRSAYNSGQVAQGFAAITVTAVLSVALVGLVDLLQNWAIPWARERG